MEFNVFFNSDKDLLTYFTILKCLATPTVDVGCYQQKLKHYAWYMKPSFVIEKKNQKSIFQSKHFCFQSLKCLGRQLIFFAISYDLGVKSRDK